MMYLGGEVRLTIPPVVVRLHQKPSHFTCFHHIPSYDITLLPAPSEMTELVEMASEFISKPYNHTNPLCDSESSV